MRPRSVWKEGAQSGDQEAGVKESAPKRYWRIRGYDSTEKIFDMTVGFGQFTEDQMRHLLRALVAKAGLNLREIVGAYARRKTKIANDLLEVHKDFAYPTYLCGSNPHFEASVVDKQGRIHRAPLATKGDGS